MICTPWGLCIPIESVCNNANRASPLGLLGEIAFHWAYFGSERRGCRREIVYFKQGVFVFTRFADRTAPFVPFGLLTCYTACVDVIVHLIERNLGQFYRRELNEGNSLRAMGWSLFWYSTPQYNRLPETRRRRNKREGMFGCLSTVLQSGTQKVTREDCSKTLYLNIRA